MKRSLDLIREILLAVESYEPEQIGQRQSISQSDFSGTDPQNWHHIKMLHESGLLDVAGKPDMQLNYAIHGMTMAGHDFLDAIRNESVWDNTKKRLGDAGGWTLDLVLAVAKEELKRRLGLGLQEL